MKPPLAPARPSHAPCPIAHNRRAGEPYVNFSVADYSDEGEELLNGTLVEKWVREEPRDPFFPPLLFELVFVDQHDAQSARPVLAQTILKPLGVVRAAAAAAAAAAAPLSHPPYSRRPPRF